MSKRIWQHPEVPAGETTVSWRSLGQLEDTPEFRSWMEREFPQGVAEMDNEEDAETSRRSFLKLMGASTALAGFGMAACRRPESYIVPYNKAPEWIIPGKATYYASSRPSASGAVPLVVTTFEGRPTKVAPNSLHPDVTGTDAFTQASVLDLYSPSRSRKVLKQGKPSSRAEFEAALAALAADKSAKVGFVFGADVSPTRSRLAKELAAKFSGAKFYSYEALSGGKVFGDGVRAVADFAKADRVVALDCDFACLDFQGSTIPFFERRKPEGKDYSKKADASSMNRLYAVESAFSLTGGMADHRLRVAPSQLAGIAAYIGRELGVSGGTPTTDDKTISWLAPLVADLKEAKGKAIVLAGSRLPDAIQTLVASINEKLGNVGEGKALRYVRTENEGFGDIAKLKADLDGAAVETVILLTPANPILDAPADLKIADAFAKAKTVIHFGERTDATALAATWHVPTSHYLESWSDARTVNGVYTVVQPMILPLYSDCASELEVLSALLADDGKLVTGEAADGKPSPAYDAVRKTFETVGGKGSEPWKKLLRDGFHAGTKFETVAATLAAGAAAAPAAGAEGTYEIVFATDSSIYDGRWIDNGWLQEAPDPISKLCWDNAALIAPQTAKDMDLYHEIVELEKVSALGKRTNVGEDGEGEHRTGPMIKITVNGATIEIPVMISFGQAEKTIVLPLGYGQGFNDEDKFNRGPKNTGTVGLVGVNSGFNVYPLRTSAAPYFVTGATVEKANKRYPLAVIQEHHAMYGRALAREVSTMTDEEKGSFATQLEGVKKQGNDAHAPENTSLYKQQNNKGVPHLSDTLHQWAMSIDLSSCMGCNACLIACQAENNIPIVGKDQVARGREMHWIRMDRYYAIDEHNKFDPGSPSFVPQPVACVQCESAPCETVCPVNATVHTEDGLNAMAYNRCIGTRYCANNCPYKARRFNFFDYNKRNPLIAHNLYKGPFGEKQVGTAPHLQRNPNVSVRMRGVMEKCTYCVQRLKDAKIRQKRGQKQEALLAGKASPDSNVTTHTLRIPVDSVKVACQEACPAGGIEFGNMLDGAEAVVNRAKGVDRNYDLLNYIGTKPRTSYLARVKNPNEHMPDAPFIGKATIHMH
ncbi:TAT-variant-translocated molybdopterin oxidoreductase [Luteolibacter soli]|uniref:TAT-variant-translocated molybdopterin oxidoreductase n=1 Tax=Luteolibacter soli TaxID=3135280 RepID=A0ABU9ASV1_9BACT